MSGHNKWSTIKQKKGKNDAARAKIFTKIGRELIVAIKSGGSADPTVNSKLKDCIAKAKAANVPNENIDRIIKKAAAGNDGANYEAVTYEGYGPSGVAVIVEALTDNRNRTAGEVRHYFDKFGGNMGTPGCVSFMFEQKGVIVIDREDLEADEDTVIYNNVEFVHLLMVSRLSGEKGIDRAIRAVAHVNARGVRACLHLVGEGGEHERLRLQKVDARHRCFEGTSHHQKREGLLLPADGKSCRIQDERQGDRDHRPPP